jgi:hypothetical protein
MMPVEQIVAVIKDELEKLVNAGHWGEVIFRVPLKHGDPQQIAIGYEKTIKTAPATGLLPTTTARP